MFSKAWLKSTAEWVLAIALGAVLAAYEAGVRDGGTLLEVAGVAAGGALVKCILASFKGNPASPALVEPPAPQLVRPIKPEEWK